MKRIFCILMTVVFCSLMFFPMIVQAKTYSLDDTDMSLQVNDSTWYVFTRENIKDNPMLDELGVTYDYIYETLYDNKAYMDALLVYEDGTFIELFVRKSELPDSDVVNLSNYSNKDVEDFAEAFAEKQSAKDYSVYENEYKFARLEYIDPKLDYYICEYITIVNKDNYTLTFQSMSEFNDAEHREIKKIVDSIEFDVDESLKEKNNSSGNKYWMNAVKGAIIGGGAGAVISLVAKKRKSNKKAGSSSDTTDAEG